MHGFYLDDGDAQDRAIDTPWRIMESSPGESGSSEMRQPSSSPERSAPAEHVGLPLARLNRWTVMRTATS
jgi:hypothetical protein